MNFHANQRRTRWTCTCCGEFTIRRSPIKGYLAPMYVALHGSVRLGKREYLSEAKRLCELRLLVDAVDHAVPVSSANSA